MVPAPATIHLFPEPPALVVLGPVVRLQHLLAFQLFYATQLKLSATASAIEMDSANRMRRASSRPILPRTKGTEV